MLSQPPPSHFSIRSLIAGLMLMACFTLMWSGIAASGLTGIWQALDLVSFTVLSLLLYSASDTTYQNGQETAKLANYTCRCK